MKKYIGGQRTPHNVVYRGNVGLHRDFLVEWRIFNGVPQIAIVERVEKVTDIPKAPDFRDMGYMAPEGLFRLANIVCAACAILLKNNKPDGLDIAMIPCEGIYRLSDYIYNGGTDDRRFEPAGIGKNWIDPTGD